MPYESLSQISSILVAAVANDKATSVKVQGNNNIGAN
jgi:hypothetical protein